MGVPACQWPEPNPTKSLSFRWNLRWQITSATIRFPPDSLGPPYTFWGAIKIGRYPHQLSGSPSTVWGHSLRWVRLSASARQQLYRKPATNIPYNAWAKFWSKNEKNYPHLTHISANWQGKYLHSSLIRETVSLRIISRDKASRLNAQTWAHHSLTSTVIVA